MTTSTEDIEVTMVSDSFKTFHPLAFKYVETLLALPVNHNHPSRGEWQSYKECNKGLTAASTWHAIKTIMGIKNIDDYKNVILRCPDIKSYLVSSTPTLDTIRKSHTVSLNQFPK